jgi:hypothetical protein
VTDRKFGSGIGLWPIYLALFYPCWWLGQAVTNALPALAAWQLSGAGLSRVRLDWRGAFARAGRTADGAIPDFALWTAVTVLLVIAVIATAAAYFRNWRPPLLYAGALVAWAGLERAGARALFRDQPDWPTLALLLGSFMALTLFLDRLPVGLLRQTYWRRLRGLACAFLVPLALWTPAAASLSDFGRPVVWPVLLAAAAAALTAARRRSWEMERVTQPWVWRSAAVGGVATVALLVGPPPLSVALQALNEQARPVVVESAPLPRIPRGFFFKGVNFTAEWPDPYGSEFSQKILEGLRERGVNAVALAPYASQAIDDVELRFPLRMERDELVAASAAHAHALGLRVLLKPHIWVRGGYYPGDLDYPDPERRAQWFASYRRYIESQAALAEKIRADVFCVGVELVQLSSDEQEWRALIAAVREIYHGPLVYAANFGAEFESVRFWDALDYIGLDNYYPLPEDLSTAAIEQKIEAVHREFAKPVLFTEAGFAGYENAYEKPWEDRPGGALSPQAQARYIEASLEGFYDKPWLHGIFWWKVGTAGLTDPADASHQLWGKPAIDVIERYYRRDPAPSVNSQ